MAVVNSLKMALDRFPQAPPAAKRGSKPAVCTDMRAVSMSRNARKEKPNNNQPSGHFQVAPGLMNPRRQALSSSAGHHDDKCPEITSAPFQRS